MIFFFICFCVYFFFGVLEFLYHCLTHKILTNKDKKDIAKRLDDTLNELKNPDGLMFDGEVLDKETADLIRSSLKNVLTTGKVLAKNKYTPKKYRNDEEWYMIEH